MATEVKNSTEAASSADPRVRLLRASVVGAVYVAVCIAVIIFGVPFLWKKGMTPWVTDLFGSFFDVAGLIVVLLVSAAGLLMAGLAISGPRPPEGLRAGVFTFLIGALSWFLLTALVGQLLERYVFKTDSMQIVGIILNALLSVAALVYAVRYCMKPAFYKFLLAFEGHGWFRTKTFKVTQGLRVRRLTILGILLLAGSGIWTLISHGMLYGPWIVHLPFTKAAGVPDGLGVQLLPDTQFTVPFILAAAGLWIGWRAVNYPTFADFLIATEAEMNKVSWTTRKRLIQDTIVVLVTVFLFTVFLLAVDQLWGWMLTRETLGGIVPKPAATSGPADVTKEIPW